jgi:hypothetical protein
MHIYNYLFSITDDDIINILLGPKLSEILIKVILVIDIQETPLWLPEQPRVILNRISFSRRVYHAKHLLEMGLHELLTG